MSEANSGMTLHSLVLSSDSFSCNCNSIQSPVSIVHLRVILTYLIPLLRVYINQHSSNAIQFSSNLYSNVTTSTRINILQCTYVHLRLFHSKLHSPLRVSSIRIYILITGFVDPIMQHISCDSCQFSSKRNSWSNMLVTFVFCIQVNLCSFYTKRYSCVSPQQILTDSSWNHPVRGICKVIFDELAFMLICLLT